MDQLFAAELLTETLARQGRLAELCAEVDAGTRNAVKPLAAALDAQGRIAEAQHLSADGLGDQGAAASSAANLESPARLAAS